MKSDDKTLKGKTGTLSDADITSQRVSRRSLLATLGLGASVAAAAVLGQTTPSEARRVCDSNSYDRCFDVTDRDPYDRAGDPYDTR